jgi:hypothetical protein
LTRQIVLGLWSHYPDIMIGHYLHALAPVVTGLLQDLGLIALAAAPAAAHGRGSSDRNRRSSLALPALMHG